jgi:predicted amidohydrolase
MKVHVAAVQAAPVYTSLNDSLEKALTLIADAARRGARLVAFGESWLPGYPAWLDCCRDVALWDHEPVKKVFARLMENSVVVPGPVTNALGEAARQHQIVLNIGVHERTAAGPGPRLSLQHDAYLWTGRRAPELSSKDHAYLHRTAGLG